jgi:hypothetical protein
MAHVAHAGQYQPGEISQLAAIGLRNDGPAHVAKAEKTNFHEAPLQIMQREWNLTETGEIVAEARVECRIICTGSKRCPCKKACRSVLDIYIVARYISSGPRLGPGRPEMAEKFDRELKRPATSQTARRKVLILQANLHPPPAPEKFPETPYRPAGQPGFCAAYPAA